MATMSPGTAELYDRLVEVLGTRDLRPEQRMAIQHAFNKPGITWDTLPADVKAMVVEAEKLPRQSWDDPMDVPDTLVD